MPSTRGTCCCLVLAERCGHGHRTGHGTDSVVQTSPSKMAAVPHLINDKQLEIFELVKQGMSVDEALAEANIAHAKFASPPPSPHPAA